MPKTSGGTRCIALISAHAGTFVSFRAPLIQALHAQRVRVLALAPNFDETSRTAVRALGAEPIDSPMARTGMNPWVDMRNTWRLAGLLRRLQPDVTLGYMVKPVIFGSIAARLARVPRRVAMVEGLGYVFTPATEVLSPRRRLLKRVVQRLYRIGMGCAHQVIFLNPDDQHEFVQMGLVPSHKTLVLGGIGVDLAQWPVLPQPAATAPFTFLMVARLLREKGVAEYAAAARLVRAQHPQARFVLLGGLDDNPGSVSQAEVEAWHTAGVIEWQGHTAVQPWLEQAHVFVLPSYREGVPMSTQEAMASGRAIISTDTPGCRETVVQGENGLLVPVRDAEALAAAMLRLIAEPALAQRMGAASRRMAEEKYDVHQVNGRILQTLGL